MKITSINDYVNELQEKFPYLKKSDIKKIISYGWKQFYLLNSYGGDVHIKGPELWLYSGKLTTNSVVHYLRYKRKLCLKLRVLYRRKKINWDGFYYFALTQQQYEKLQSQQNKRGRKRRIFDYGTIYAYKIKDECCIQENNKTYIMRFPYPIELGFKIKLENFKSDKVEFVETQNIAKFKDILINNYNYEYL